MLFSEFSISPSGSYRRPFPVKKKGSVSPFDLTVSGIREPYSETLKSHQHLTQLKNALLLIYESHLTSESNLERLISKILSQPVPYPSSGIPTNIFKYCPLSIRPPQDVDVLAVLDFENPCFCSETLDAHPRRLLTKNEGQDKNKDAWRRRRPAKP